MGAKKSHKYRTRRKNSRRSVARRRRDILKKLQNSVGIQPISNVWNMDLSSSCPVTDKNVSSICPLTEESTNSICPLTEESTNSICPLTKESTNSICPFTEESKDLSSSDTEGSTDSSSSDTEKSMDLSHLLMKKSIDSRRSFTEDQYISKSARSEESAGMKAKESQDYSRNISLEGSLEKIWKSPLIKEHFSQEKKDVNIAVCKLCSVRRKIGFGNCIKLEQHLIAHHRVQYDQFQSDYRFKPPLKTYTRHRNQVKDAADKDSSVRQESKEKSKTISEMHKEIWEEPFVKKFFTNCTNLARCLLCEKVFTISVGNTVKLEHHIKVKHSLEYEKFQKVHWCMLKPPLRTYSRTSLQNKRQLNNEGHKNFDTLVNSEKSLETNRQLSLQNKRQLNKEGHKNFDTLVNGEKSLETNRQPRLSLQNKRQLNNEGHKNFDTLVNGEKSLETNSQPRENSICVANPGKAYYPGELCRLVAFHKTPNGKSKNASRLRRSKKPLASKVPERTTVYSKNSDEGKVLIPDALPDEVTATTDHSKICDEMEAILPDALPNELTDITEIKEEMPDSDSLINVRDHQKPDTRKRNCHFDVNPSIQSSKRTYSRPRKSLSLVEHQGASSINRLNFSPYSPSSSTCNFKTDLEDQIQLNSEEIQDCEDSLNSISLIATISDGGSTNMGLSEDLESILPDPHPKQLKGLSEDLECNLPDPHPKQLKGLSDDLESILPDSHPEELKKPKEEPPDTYEQEDPNLCSILPNVPHFTSWVKKEPE